MNNIWVYDFDNTIYDGDSSVDFFLFCLRKKISLIKFLPIILYYTFLYFIKKISVKEYKEKFFCFLKNIPNIDDMIELFWKEHKNKIHLFFLDALKQDKRSKICIISASPRFLLEGFTKDLKNVTLISTEMDKKTGEIIGENCKGEEKLKRYKKEFNNNKIAKFYSDSKADEPLAKLSKEAFIVKEGKIFEWQDSFFESIKQKKIIKFLFIFFTIFYFILGIYFTYFYTSKMDFLFGADNKRVIGDITNIFYNHYRVKVHPLYILLLQPLTLILSGLTIDKLLAAIIISSIVSSLSVILIYKIATMFIKNEKIKILISLMFGFSFSQLVFTASIESFNFASFFLILLWYFVIKMLKETEKPKNYFIILVLLGIVSFGITITNIIVFLIALFILWLGKKLKLKQIVGIIIFVALATFGLSAIQHYTWHNTPFLTQKENYQEEQKYTEFNFSLSKLNNVFTGDYVYSIFANDINVNPNATKKKVRFNNISNINMIISSIFYIYILVQLVKNFRKNKLLNFGIILSLLFNTILHIFYGNGETFLYSCHFNYLLFLILIINYSNPKVKKKITLSSILLILFAIYEIISNFKVFKKLLFLTSKYLTKTYYRNFHNPWLLIGIIVIILLLTIFIYIIFKMIKKIFSSTNKNKILYIIISIICLIFINLIFININTIAHYDNIFDTPLNVNNK